MENGKILLTKELVISFYKRSLFHRLYTCAFAVVYLVLYFVSLGFLLKMSTYSFSILGGIGMLSLFALIFLCEIIYVSSQVVKVLKGKFYITTDKIKERKRPHTKRNRARNPLFIFEKYGHFYINKAYSFKDKKAVAAREQFKKAYDGDIYYVAIMHKSRNIIAVFDADEYYLQDE